MYIWWTFRHFDQGRLCLLLPVYFPARSVPTKNESILIGKYMLSVWNRPLFRNEQKEIDTRHP